MLTGCMPSTSLSGSIASSAASKSICGGVGCWMRKPSTSGSSLNALHRGEHVGLASRPRAGAGAAPTSRARAPSPSSCRRSARWRRRRRRGSCRGPGVCPLAMSFSLRGTRSANTASATGPPGIILRPSALLVTSQWRKCRSPVNTMARPSSSARSMLGSSRIAPPGCTTTATPAAAAASMPSGNG